MNINMRGSYLHQLNKFLESSSVFSVIYTSPKSDFVLPLTTRINILDSSFNPPHKGHISLVKYSILQKLNRESKNTSSLTINDKSVLLLLSVQNADKEIQLASFSDRLDMMYLLADTIHQEYGVSVSIGLTKNAFFADKATCIKNYLKTTYNRPDIKLSFLMGFDTLIRVFNPKYYTPLPLSTALETLMGISDFLVLTRDDGVTSLESQFEFVKKIKDGSSDLNVPSEWADKIFMIKGDDESLSTSSSAIRKSIQLDTDDENWKKDTTTGIAEYITEHMPYKE